MRRILAIALLALVAMTGACDDFGSGKSCGTVPQEYELSADTESAPMRLGIESCRRDVDACPQLCARVIAENHVVGVVNDCTVEFTASTVRVAIDINTCPQGFPDPDDQNVPGGTPGSGSASGSGI